MESRQGQPRTQALYSVAKVHLVPRLFTRRFPHKASECTRSALGAQSKEPGYEVVASLVPWPNIKKYELGNH